MGGSEKRCNLEFIILVEVLKILNFLGYFEFSISKDTTLLVQNGEGVGETSPSPLLSLIFDKRTRTEF